MSFGAFLLEAALISLSGVMGPGPMTAVSFAKGAESPHAGAWVAIGHGVFEFPLMIAIFYGLGRFLELPYIKPAIALVGGLFLLFMGIGMLRSLHRAEFKVASFSRSPLVAGIVLSAGNPYFLIWWATVGAALVARSARFGLAGFAVFAFLHWMCDLVWYEILSVTAFKGGKMLGQVFQRVILAVCGLVLLFFGGRFVLDAVRAFPI